MPKILPNATDLYAITAANLSLGRPLLEVVDALLASGIHILQYREKHLPMRRVYEECLLVRSRTAEAGCCFIVDDYVDVALATGADGVHIGQEDLPVEVVRSLVGDRLLIGVSTHEPKQAKAALEGGADYIGVGPIFETKTKENVVDPVGLTYLSWVAKEIPLPFVAIGGIKAHNIGSVVKAGASCCALVSEFVGAADIGAKVREVRQKMHA